MDKNIQTATKPQIYYITAVNTILISDVKCHIFKVCIVLFFRFIFANFKLIRYNFSIHRILTSTIICFKNTEVNRNNLVKKGKKDVIQRVVEIVLNCILCGVKNLSINGYA